MTRICNPGRLCVFQRIACNVSHSSGQISGSMRSSGLEHRRISVSVVRMVSFFYFSSFFNPLLQPVILIEYRVIFYIPSRCCRVGFQLFALLLLSAFDCSSDV
ncbi:hypothetical protein CDAR_575001 [Caerostris darwini]|uniref:Uncharacterized protein n=1 Tax=Caerostris darwini TaxID=1538125 RepID=A0AAV4SW73_9ARAC|nr:hypothetical protein CDAR_575001 [Caerostris darwini]